METLAAAALILLSVLFAGDPTTAAAAAPPLPPQTCADEILLVSPCLPYISQPPNDLDVNPTPKCCQVFSSVVTSGSSACFCYLIRDPAMLGFLLNTTRLLSLSSVCSPKASNESLASVCSAQPPLPPLQATPDPSNQHPSGSSASPARSPRLGPSSPPPPHPASVPEAAAADDAENSPSVKPPTLQWFIKSAAAPTHFCLITGLVHNVLLIVLSGL